jgi:predicted nucleic acid-binding Zn ribbon protein
MTEYGEFITKEHEEYQKNYFLRYYIVIALEIAIVIWAILI